MDEVFDAFRAEVLQMMDDESIWARCGGLFARFDLPLNHMWGERCDGVVERMVSSKLAFKSAGGWI